MTPLMNAGCGLSLFVLAFGADHVEIIGHLRQYFTIRLCRLKGWHNLKNCYIMAYTLSGYSRLENYRCSGFWLSSIGPQVPRFSLLVFSQSSNPLK